MVIKKSMNKKVLLFFTIMISPILLFGQTKRERGEVFKITIEPSMVTLSRANLESKTPLLKRMFPDNNAMAEYFADPSFNGAYGFMISDSNNNYQLEVKWVSNWKETKEKVSKEFPVKDSNLRVMEKKTKEEQDKILTFNRQQYAKQSNKAISEYVMLSKKIAITPLFANQFHETYVALIKNYKNKGTAPVMLDGTRVVFRCVVDNEVWNFSILEPSGNFGRLMKICNDIVRDVQENKKELDENEYIQRLVELTENQ